MNEYSTIIGMDLGDEYSYWAVMVQDDEEIQEEGRVRTTEEALKRKFCAMKPARIAMEAGTHSAWVERLLTGCGHCVIVANPRKLRMIYKSDIKNDKVDARMLARLARVDINLLSPIEHRGEKAQSHLAVLKARNALVSTRTDLINHVRGVVKSLGCRIPKCSAESFHKKACGAMPESLRTALGPVVEVIGELTKKICPYDKEIETLCCEEYPETELFRGISGVGPVTALAFSLTIAQAERFTSSRDVGSHLGLTPRQDQSGEQNPQLRITKAGNSYMRRLLVGSAQYILGKLNKQDSELRTWGLKLAGPVDSKGKHNKRLKNRAVVAVARKLAVLLHTIWSTGEIYDPFYQQSMREQDKEAA
ncbi:MAG: IS110 family transposase [Bacteroidales bacterium]|nr:IS110 family transposase [Candidatus Latescibacterota bacterium]